MKQIVIYKEKKRGYGQEYKVEFKEDGKVVHTTICFGNDLKYVNRMFKREWQTAKVYKMWEIHGDFPPTRTTMKKFGEIVKQLQLKNEYIRLPGKKSFAPIITAKLGEDKITKCAGKGCETTLSIKYVQTKGLKCPRCKHEEERKKTNEGQAKA